MDEAMWQEVEEGCGLNLEVIDEQAKMVQCPYCRNAASGLCLREPVGEKVVATTVFAEITSARQGASGHSSDPSNSPPASRSCAGREGACRRRFDKSSCYSCTSPDLLLCERCFHAYDHAEHPFIKITASDEEGSSETPVKEMAGVTDVRLAKLLVRMQPHNCIPHIEKCHLGKKVRARCTLCPTKKLLSPSEMLDHLRTAHHLGDRDGFRREHPVTLLGDDFVFAEAPQQRVEIRKSSSNGNTPVLGASYPPLSSTNSTPLPAGVYQHTANGFANNTNTFNGMDFTSGMMQSAHTLQPDALNFIPQQDCPIPPQNFNYYGMNQDTMPNMMMADMPDSTYMNNDMKAKGNSAMHAGGGGGAALGYPHDAWMGMGVQNTRSS